MNFEINLRLTFWGHGSSQWVLNEISNRKILDLSLMTFELEALLENRNINSVKL